MGFTLSDALTPRNSMSEQFVRTLQRARVKRTILSPTRRNNPQPLGLVYQSPLHPNAPHLAIWNHEPTFRQTISRFPDLTSHLGMVNFSSGKLQSVWPCDRQREPPVIKHSLKSTNGPARGIVPRSFPRTCKVEEKIITTKLP